MPVEFLGIGATHNGTETTPRSGPAFDKEYTLALARAHEETGWDRMLTAYSSGSPRPGAGRRLHRRPHRAAAAAAGAPAQRQPPDVRRQDRGHPGPDPGRALRPRAVDGHRAGHRRCRQLHGAGRHPGDGGRVLLDHYDLGVRILSARGYDLLADAREFGREVIPLVRAEVARRDAAAAVA